MKADFEISVSAKYGAPLGRAASGIGTLRGKVSVRRVRLDSGGYDRGGAYWGIGEPLFYAYDSGEGSAYFRAPSREAALKRLFGTATDYDPSVWPSERVRRERLSEFRARIAAKEAEKKSDPSESRGVFTYSVLPSREAFDAAFEAKIPPGGFRFGNDPRLGNCALSADALWVELERAVREFEEAPDSDAATSDDGPGYWASAVLSVLGFEWI